MEIIAAYAAACGLFYDIIKICRPAHRPEPAKIRGWREKVASAS